MEFLVFLLIGVAILAVVGHGIWVLVRVTIRGLARLFDDDDARPIPAEICPRCRELLGPHRGPGRCVLCGWSQVGVESTGRARADVVLGLLRQRVEWYAQLGLLRTADRDRLIEAIRAGEAPPDVRPVAATVVPPIHVVEADTIEWGEVHSTTVPAAADRPTTTADDLRERAAAYRVFRDEGATPIRAAEPEPHGLHSQGLFRVLSAFLEEKSIRWGELVGGLLIVGCSLALVISFWSSIADRPLLKYVLFNGVTAGLFGLGVHAERRWKLPTTAAGLLTIATLLTPLNFLAVASLARGGPAETIWGAVGELSAVAIFAALLSRAGRSLVGATPWTLPVGVLLPSATMLLMRRSLDPGGGLSAGLALAALPLLAQAAAVGGRIARARHEPEIGEGTAWELLRLLGLSSFAAAIAVGLVLAHGGPIGEGLHRLSPLAPLAGASILAPGLLLWRRTVDRELIGYRTAGAAIAAAGTLVLLAGIPLAWPVPARMLPVALLNFAVLTAIAMSFRVAAAHAVAGLCLAMAYLIGWALAVGRLGWQGLASTPTADILLSAGAGAALVPIALIFGVVAGAGVRWGRRQDARAFAVVAASAGLLSLGLVTWLGFGRDGDPAGVTWVCLAYAVAATGFAFWFGHHPLAEGSSGDGEARVLGWLGAGLLLTALIQGKVFGGLVAPRDLPWIASLLAHATLMTAAGGWIGRAGAKSSSSHPPDTPGPEDADFAPTIPDPSPIVGIVTGIFDRSAIATSVLAGCGLAIMVPVSAPPDLAVDGLWLALIWWALAWRHASPALFAAGQAACTGGIVFAVAAMLGMQGWYVRSPLPWLDPRTIQAQGLAMGVACLGWIGLRLGVRARSGGWPGSSTRASLLGRLLEPPWPAFDRVLRGVVVATAMTLAVYAALPGVAQELTPRDLTVRLGGVEASGRVVPPAAAFEIPDVPHAHALGAGSWVLLGLTVVVLLAGQWERPRRPDLLAAMVVAAMAAPLLAGRWESSVAAASALRWAGAVAMLGAACLVWGREGLARWGDRLGWRFDAEGAVGLRRMATGTVLAIGLLPPAAMAASVGTAALIGRTLDVGMSQAWAIASGLFVVLGTASLGLRRAEADRRPWVGPAGSLLAVLGTLPLVAVTVFLVSSALAGNPIAGPEPGSFFRRVGLAGSYVPPIVLLAATLVGFAVRERSSSFAFAAGLTLNLAATAAFLMAGAKGGLAFDATLWVRLAQINAIVASATALAWMGSVSAWRRRRGERGPAPGDGLLTVSIALGVTLNLLVLIAGTAALLLDPTPSPALRAIAGVMGLVAPGLAAWSVVVRASSLGRPVSVDWCGLGLLCAADLLSLTLVSRDTGDWLAYHGLLVGQATAGVMLPLLAWHVSGLRASTLTVEARSAVGRWSTVALGVVVLFAVRGYWTDPQSPWWTVGGLAAMGALAAALACWSVAPGYLRLASVLLNLAATAWWCASPAWGSGPGGWWTLADLANVNVLALALPAPLWLLIERRDSWPARSVPLHRVASWSALGMLTILVATGLGNDSARGAGEVHALLGWAALAATALAMGCGLWNDRSRATVAGLYLLGLCGAGWALGQFRLPPPRLAWAGTMVLSAYSLGTSFLWARRASLRGWADRLGLPRPVASDVAWLVPANLTLAAGVLALALGTILTDPDAASRSSAALAAGAECLSVGLLARGARRSRLRAVALGTGIVGALAWGWAWIVPGAATEVLDRAAVALVVVVGGAALYGLGLTKLPLRASDWTPAARRLVPPLLFLAGAVLAVILGVEVSERYAGRDIPMSGGAVAAVAAALVGAVVAGLVAAVVPGLDPLGLSERGRSAYVYGCEAVLAALVAHLRLALPWLFSGLFARYWPLILLGVAFVGVGLGELFRRQGRLVLAGPLERTGALLPVFPLLAASWAAPTPGEDVLFLALVGGLYATLSALRSSTGFAALAALACNGALWAWLGHREWAGLLEHPQLWVIPPALCVLVGAHLNRDRLTDAQTAGTRYAASTAIYLASTADIVLTGVANAPWLPAVLAALSVAGIFAGILMRVRGFLYLGLGFLTLSLFSIVWYAAVDLRQTWLWAASGVAAGIAILAVFALFEKKRQEVLRVVDQLREWDP